MAMSDRHRKLALESIKARKRAVSHVHGLKGSDGVDMLTASDVLNVSMDYMKKLVDGKDIDSMGTGDDVQVRAGSLLEYKEAMERRTSAALGRMMTEDAKYIFT